MKQFVEKGLIGSGKFFLNARRVGNVSAAKLAYGTEKKTLPNKQGGGGNVKSKEQISECTLGITITNTTAENIAVAMQAIVEEFPSATVTDEVVVGFKNGLATTATMIDVSQPVTVKDAADAPIASNLYEVSAAGIVLKEASNHTDGDNIKVSYTSHVSSVIQAATNFGAEFGVVLDGLNDDNGEPHVLKVHKWKPGPTTGFDLISDDYASFELNGEVLADTTKPVGKSQFFELHTIG